MGQIYQRLGKWSEADACFARAAGLGDAPWEARSVEQDIRADALRRLALERRRQRRYQDAADAWQHLLDSGAGPAVTREARRALAIHHEHRVRDLDAARQFAEGALASEKDPVEAEALRHRLARLGRKLDRGKTRWSEGG
jgi:tetratricopeptide (TPR) repeat protein